MPKSFTVALLAKKTVYPALLGLGFLAASFALPSLGQVAHAAPAGNSANSGGQVYNDLPNLGNLSYIGKYAPTSGNANDASVLINSDSAGNVLGGYSISGNAINNMVVINGGNVGWHVLGGYSISGNAINNRMVISGGSVGEAVFGGMSDSGNASNNSVVVSGGNISAGVYGGDSLSGNATNNSVIISGGNIGENVFGGYSEFGNAINNQVTLLGKPVFIKNGVNETIIYGGFSFDPATTGDLRTGNTLNVFSSGIEAKNIANFQHYNFLLQASNNAGLTLLDVAGTDLGGNLTPAPTLAMPYAVSGAVLPINRTITLLQSAGPLSNVPVLNNGQALQGASLLYNYSLAQSGNSIVATINGVKLNPQAKALSQGRLAGLASLSMGADLVAGAGMNNALAATNAANSDASAANSANSGAAPAGGSDAGNADGNLAPAGARDQGSVQGYGQSYGLVPFMAVSTSFLRYNVGSSMDVDGTAVMLGLAKKWQGSSAEFLLGAFAEASLSNNKSHNSFSKQASVTGKSNNDSVGGGILARMELTGTALKGLYTEASLRVGQLNSHYKSSDLQDYLGNTVSYDTDSIYYGAHAGLGYILSLSDKASLDLYGKYFWTHQEGETVKILGDEFKFDDANSQRTRLGGRVSYALCDELAPYAGAAWEYEFDGKAKATTYGFDVPAPSLEGSTGVGELGISFTPVVLSKNAFSVDLGLQGYTGMREGVSGSVQMKFEF